PDPCACSGAGDGRGAPAPPHQPERLLPRQEGRLDQGRRVVVAPAAMPVTVAVDAMGGDHGPSVTLAAALEFLEETPDARVIAVGPEPALRTALAKLSSPARDR